jgi:phosphoketolase
VTRDQNESIVALSATERALIDAYWRAANYLSVGQIYLYDNPLLKQPLTDTCCACSRHAGLGYPRAAASIFSWIQVRCASSATTMMHRL